MKFITYQKLITKYIKTLSHKDMVCFCFLCCERLYPLYNKFCEQEKWGNPQLLEDIRIEIRKWLEYDIKITNLEQLISEIEEITPDSEEFSNIYCSYALNASISHMYTIELLEEINIEYVKNVAQLCYDTVDFHVQELIDPDYKGNVDEKLIENHPLMINEINWQFNTMKSLNKLDDITLKLQLIKTAIV